MHGSALTHEEMEFCAEDETVTVVPSFSTGESLVLLCGTFPPFRAQARRRLCSVAALVFAAAARVSQRLTRLHLDTDRRAVVDGGRAAS